MHKRSLQLTRDGSGNLPHVLEVGSDIVATSLSDCLVSTPSCNTTRRPRCENLQTYTSPGWQRQCWRRRIEPDISLGVDIQHKEPTIVGLSNCFYKEETLNSNVSMD